MNNLELLRARILESNASEFQKQIELQKLNAMFDVCETVACRRVLLLRNFDEESEPCQNCDNCLHPPTQFDGTEMVQKLLSCVYRVGQRFHASYVINVLRGKADDWIEQNQHHQLSTFGIGSSLSDKNWRNIIRQCIGQGLLSTDLNHYQALMLTEASKAVLKGQTKVMLRPLKRDREATRAVNREHEWLRTEREERLWQALRAWRLQKAQSENVPAYVIFGDKTLQEITQNQPHHLAQLSQIYGLGEAKIKKFGQEILAICAEFAD